MSSMIANPVYRYLLLLTCLLRDLMLVVTAERSADGISVYSGVQSVFPSRFRGGWTCSVCTQHGILSSCCCWLPGFTATHETVSIVDTVVSLTLRIVLFVSDNYVSKCICTHTHTHPFNGPLSGTTHVSRYQKGKNQSGFYWSKRQWVAVASAGPHASLHLAPDRKPCQHPTTQFLQAGCPSCRPTNSVKALKG